MKDLFQDYKKQNSRKNGMIIAISLVFAFSINTFLFGTDIGARLQTSVINSTAKTNTTPADLIIVNAGTGTDMLKIETTNRIESITRMVIPVAFDPESLSISNIFSENKNVEIVNNSNIPGYSVIYINFKKPQNIAEKTSLLTIVYKKKVSKKTVLNLWETQFMSTDGALYDLTNKPIEF